VEDRETALPDVGAIGAGNPQHVQPDVLSVFGAKDVLTKTAQAEVSVHQHGGIVRDRR